MSDKSIHNFIIAEWFNICAQFLLMSRRCIEALVHELRWGGICPPAMGSRSGSTDCKRLMGVYVSVLGFLAGRFQIEGTGL